MTKEGDRLKIQLLRQKAEAALKDMGKKPDISTDMAELMHELAIYQVELELQLEELSIAYNNLSAAHTRYERLFQFAPTGFLVTDRQDIIQDANHTALVMLDVSREQLLNTRLAALLAEDAQDDYHLHRRASQADEGTSECQLRVWRGDGSTFHAALRTHRLDDDNQHFHTVLIDMSQAKATEAALQRALEHEQSMNDLRSRTLSVIGHEFRTPLAVIISSLEILRNYDHKMTPEKRQAKYRTMNNYAWYLSDNVQDVVSVEEFGDDLPRLRPQTFDLGPFVREFVDDFALIHAEGQSIQLDISAAQAQEMVTWDKHLVRRLLMNLLSNALRYSDEDVILRVLPQAETVSFAVVDHGQGISADDQSHMYEPFYRGSVADSIPGTGIGLFVVRRAVTAHQGQITCTSAPNQGTTFTVELPRHAA